YAGEMQDVIRLLHRNWLTHIGAQDGELRAIAQMCEALRQGNAIVIESGDPTARVIVGMVERIERIEKQAAEETSRAAHQNMSASQRRERSAQSLDDDRGILADNVADHATAPSGCRRVSKSPRPMRCSSIRDGRASPVRWSRPSKTRGRRMR